MKLNKAIDSFLQEQKARGNTLKTCKDYKQYLTYFLDYCGDINVLDIDKNKILSYIVYLREKPKNLGHKNKKVDNNVFVSSCTVQTYVRHLRAFFTWCYENEYTEINLSDKFKLPKAKKELKKILTDDEVERIFKACKKTNCSLRNSLIISLMLYSGLRASEVIHLKKDSYNSKDNTLIVFGKGQKERIVPVGKSTDKLFREYLKFMGMKLRYKKNLFLNWDDEPLTYNAVRLMIDKIAKDSKVYRLHPHLLRHTFATRYLIKTKGDITSLKAILGHTSLKMVENYLHLAMEYSIGQYREFCE